MNTRGNRIALALLTASAVLSALIYTLAFSRPYNLIALHDQPYLDLGRLSTSDPRIYWRLSFAFAGLGLFYLLGWRTARRTLGPAAWAVVAGGALACALVLLYMYPLGATDIFSDIMYGRIISQHGGNPFLDAGAAFPNDPFYGYMGWRDTPTHYGPLCNLLFAATARLAGDGVIANVLAFKLLNVLFLAASIALVADILRQAAPEWALAGTLALAWNPVVLYETIGNGHNDILMVFWILAAVWGTARHRYTLAILALVAGALTKFVPALLIPAAGLVALRRLETRPRQLRFLLTAGLGSLALTVLVYLPFWRGSQTLTFLQRKHLFTMSLPAFIRALLIPRLGEDTASSVVGLAAYAAIALFALWQAQRARHDATWLAFPRAAYSTLLFYLLFACAWYKEWYTIWPLAVAAVIPSAQALIPALLFNVAGLSLPLVFGPIWFGRPGLSGPALELRLALAAMLLPALYLAAQPLWRRLQARARLPSGP